MDNRGRLVMLRLSFSWSLLGAGLLRNKTRDDCSASLDSWLDDVWKVNTLGSSSEISLWGGFSSTGGFSGFRHLNSGAQCWLQKTVALIGSAPPTQSLCNRQRQVVHWRSTPFFTSPHSSHSPNILSSLNPLSALNTTSYWLAFPTTGIFSVLHSV